MNSNISVALVGNCQARGIERCFAALRPDLDVKTYHLNRIHRANTSLDPLEKWLAEVNSADVVFCVDPLPSNLKVFTEEAISRSSGKVIRYPYLATKAYHPDCCYIRSVANYDENPMGPYHSVIAATGFCLGLSVGRTEMLFNNYVFAKLGMIGQFEHKKRAIIERAASLGYDVDGVFSSHECNMHTINHPKISALRHVAMQALLKAGIVADENSGGDIYDELALGPRWPVYPGVASGIQGNFMFSLGDDSLGLREFIEEEYNVFEKSGSPPVCPEVIRATPIVKEILVDA